MSSSVGWLSIAAKAKSNCSIAMRNIFYSKNGATNLVSGICWHPGTRIALIEQNLTGKTVFLFLEEAREHLIDVLSQQVTFVDEIYVKCMKCEYCIDKSRETNRSFMNFL